MKVVLSPNPYRDRGLKAALKAREILKSGGVDTSLCLPFDLEQGSGHAELPRDLDYRNMQDELERADILLCFGGDGTILHAARDANAHNVPILGVNMGSVGFMAELEHSELDMLSQLSKRKYTIEPRMMLDVSVRRGRETLYRDLALNDAVITKGAVARVIDLIVRGDGVHIYDYSGDGVILATPTGSTAYSMSAGGPIVEPTAKNLLLTPICPHSTRSSSYVLSPDHVITVEAADANRKFVYLSVDGGKAFSLKNGDQVRVSTSKYTTKLVRLSKKSFCEILDKKMGTEASKK